MNLLELFTDLLGNTESSLRLFLPELILCGTILVLLALRIFSGLDKIPSWIVALAGSGLALYYAAPWVLLEGTVKSQEIFTGMLLYDGVTVFFRGLLLFFAILFILLTRVTELVQSEDDADIATLVLGATLGMCLMASANHLLMIFMAVEMASVPSYVMAGMLKSRRRSSEAALKYSVYGAGTAGVMLYGISLIAGVVGSCHLPTIAASLADPSLASQLPTMPLVLGGLMLAVGLAFKLSAVPFHFWCPDVFEGAPAEVGGFLSVASKAAAMALLVRVAVGFAAPAGGGVDVASSEPIVAPVVATAAFASQVEGAVTLTAADTAAEPDGLLGSVRYFIVVLIALVSAITCTFGNLAAYGQTNIKRLLAYSTIAHAGYMMMPVAAAIHILGEAAAGYSAAAGDAVASVLLYTAIYLFMNLGAFAIVAILRNNVGSEEIRDYAGLVQTSPGLVICFALILFSLIGLPPLAGFVGKYAIFYALVEGNLISLLIVGGLNTAVSLFFYLRVIKVMTIDPPPEDRGPVSLSLISLPGIYVTLITAPVLLLIIQWDGLVRMAQAACRALVQ
ncbi:MAG: NADH-quinone oxidoreductase subunit N [Planctomycetota bacterium]|nr:MAG: NADH-quinone oxidoreductase subunit N [Planctomycetota bacterium]REJ92200.1 MAG: NADH-quinone oxidoreductase subunit N [Planctomycetota bacterium]REK25500.1 MAG: NADH-quinone oxidoreductase subunit N [Planctomycetota bacterium]REK45934.1 MAG: NADH-quinone oxidoreductase subunit N [Planctomycetota bacterium]